MAVPTDARDRIARFTLSDRQKNPIMLRREWWLIRGIYLSDVCLAVHLTPFQPRTGDIWDPTLAKEDLYAFLRWLGHTSMEHDLTRPVAGVAQDKDFRDFSRETVNILRTWGGDQEWHRGGFSFYLEQGSDGDNAIINRLADLLDPTPEVLESYEPRDLRDTDSLIRMLEEHLALPQNSRTATLARELYESLSGWAREPAGKKFVEDILDPWLEKIFRQADHLAEGGSP